MRVAVIGGTGVYAIEDRALEPQVVDTIWGQAQVFLGQGESEDLVFLARHGPDHRIPPHRINYRANLKADGTLGDWSEAAALPVAITGHTMAAVHECLFIAGGETESGAVSTVYTAQVHPDGTVDSGRNARHPPASRSASGDGE